MSFSKSVLRFVGSGVVFNAIFLALYVIFKGSLSAQTGLIESVILAFWFALGFVVLMSSKNSTLK